MEQTTEQPTVKELEAKGALKTLALKTLTIKRVSFDLLDLQRVILDRIVGRLESAPEQAILFTETERDALSGVVNMLNYWRDNRDEV